MEGAAAAEEDSDWLEEGLRPRLPEAGGGSTGMPEHNTQHLISMPEWMLACLSTSRSTSSPCVSGFGPGSLQAECCTSSLV